MNIFSHRGFRLRRTAIKKKVFPLLDFVMLDILSCSFTSISFVTYYKLSIYLILCLSVMLDSLSCSFTYISFVMNSIILSRPR